MDTELWDAWIRILRDTLIVALGAFMLIFETVFAANPSAELIGAGLALFGLPPVLRLDLRQSGEKKPRRRRPDPPDEDDERWSHLP